MPGNSEIAGMCELQINEINRCRTVAVIFCGNRPGNAAGYYNIYTGQIILLYKLGHSQLYTLGIFSLSAETEPEAPCKLQDYKHMSHE